MNKIINENRIAGLDLKIKILYIIVISGALLIITRLWDLQIKRGAFYKRLSKNNIIKDIKVPHLRGRLFDRKGRLIAGNGPSFQILISPVTFKNTKRSWDILQKTLNFSDEQILLLKKEIESKRGYERFRDIVIMQDVDLDTVAGLEARRPLIDGIDIVTTPIRYYNNIATSLFHQVGYTGHITQKLFKKLKKKGYDITDRVGLSGIERVYEDYLRGKDGFRRIVVDSHGVRLDDQTAREILSDEEFFSPPISGDDLFLTIDIDIQKEIVDTFSGHSGAIVAMDPKNGEILGIASFPSVDPNLLIRGLSKKDKEMLDSNPYSVWLNRVTSALYSPGSTIKPFILYAAMKEGVINEKSFVNCKGGLFFGKRFFKCWKRSGHGYVDPIKAIYASCDTFFYKIGTILSADTIARYLRMFGFGESTDIDWTKDKSGLVPDSSYYKKRYGYVAGGFNLNTAIGQGDLLVTSLQLAVAYSALINGGKIVVPQIVKTIKDKEGRIIKKYKVKIKRHIPLDEKIVDIIKKGLFSVVNRPGGTAYFRKSKIFKDLIAGKTGTVQTVSKNKNSLRKFKDNALFVGFAPYDNPEIVVVVINEGAGHGSSGAAPIAIRIIEKFLELNFQG